jgi:hypothetical protein
MSALQRILDELSRMWATALPRFKDFVESNQAPLLEENDHG